MNANHRLTDITAEQAKLLRSHPQLPALAAPIILRYRPNSAAMAGAWSATRSFTVETAAAMLPHSFDVTRRLMTMSASFHMWVWARTGTALTVRRVYTQNNIDRFLDAVHKHRSAGHRWGVSRQLCIDACLLYTSKKKNYLSIQHTTYYQTSRFAYTCLPH
ncbi:hypothetical protein, partial [Microbacterium sp. AR7-10]|uniref:hypothetical protein n=1 Tax=Microbacterium sp. AR7-10 TaxID=1891970 RepID=UPI001C43103B